MLKDERLIKRLKRIVDGILFEAFPFFTGPFSPRVLQSASYQCQSQQETGGSRNISGYCMYIHHES